MPNCSHSSVTVKRALRANITKRIISSIGVTVFQAIVLGSVTHHSGLFVTHHSGSYRHGFWRRSDRMGFRQRAMLASDCVAKRKGMRKNKPINQIIQAVIVVFMFAAFGGE